MLTLSHVPLSQYAVLTHSRPDVLPHAPPTATRCWQEPDAQ